ncbi:hypothetical protein [Agrobacterium larrymoorei]|uniref:Alcohol dehydrogenase-like C-terminal domain-containing protein n=1 Tax=Agrobacterium larrymoorei TaxID=160699 RepID=A0ABX8T9Z9_9HYPH|nr:hypothetical protein [Agrobacterium larrymoorei]QYA10124.1 hypothetical protein J5285_23195 [Agrobacterium larrymoorei]
MTSILRRDWAVGPPTLDQGWGLESPDEEGVLAEYVVLRAERIAAAPKTLTLEEANGLPCAALTAWTALNGNRPYLKPVGKGDKVLATGTGAVALFSVLFAQTVRAKAVVTTSRDNKSVQVHALGAVDVINYKTIQIGARWCSKVLADSIGSSMPPVARNWIKLSPPLHQVHR